MRRGAGTGERGAGTGAALMVGVAALLWSGVAAAQDGGVGADAAIQTDAAITDAPLQADAGVPDAAMPDAAPAEPEEPPIPAERLPRVEASIEPDEVEIGEVARLVIEVEYQPGDRVHLRDQRRVGELEILDTSRSVRDEGEEGPSEVLELRLIGFDVGEVEIPPVELMVVLEDGRTGSVSTEPLRLRITDPLANEHDPQPRGDHPPRPVYTTDRRAIWAGAIIVGLLLAVLLGLAIERWRSRRKPKPAPPPPPPRPPEEVALEKLDAVKRGTLLEDGEIKAFHIAISEAVREYLGGRYGFDSLEMTTKEIILRLDAARLRGVTRAELQEFLRETDMVKFAKWRPSVERSRELLDQAYAIVRRTTAAHRAAGEPFVEPSPSGASEPPGGSPPPPRRPEPPTPKSGADAGGADGS